MRNTNTRVLLAMIIFVAVFFLTSCSGNPNPPAAAASAGQSTTVQQVVAQTTPTAEITREPIAARVNDQTIPLAALNREVERRLEGMRALNEAAPADMAGFRASVLDTLIDQLLIEQAAAIQGIVVTDTDVENEVQETISIAGSRENWLAQLQADGLTEQEYRERLRSSLITLRMRDVVTGNVCTAVEQVRARHILVADAGTAAQVKAELDGGNDFVSTAAKYSLDVTTKTIGGDLGWFARGQLFQPAVEEAAFTQPVSAVGAPVQSELGYHIIQVLERSTERPPDPETCYRLSESAFERWIRDLASKAQIEKYPDGR